MLCKTVSSLQPDVGRGFLHVSNVFLLGQGSKVEQFVTDWLYPV